MNITNSFPTTASRQSPFLGRFDADWRKSIVIVAVSLLIIDILHYSTAPGISQLHAIYRYFYFLPIVYAALRFGLWGGLIATTAATLVFIPHIAMRWQDHPIDTLNDLLVVVVLFGVAIITGKIVDQMNEAQAKQIAISEDLADSYRKLENQGAELRRSERLASLGTLVGGLAHQIRNPVAIISVSSELLGDVKSREISEVAAVIQYETDRIEQLVSRLLNYAGEQAVQRAPTDLHLLLEQVQCRVQMAAESLGIQVELSCNKDISAWNLDAEQIEEALVNLCMNAVQAIETENSRDTHQNNACVDTIHLSARIENLGERQLSLTIRDSGPGIPEHIQLQIFDPFFTTKDAGIGLGLSVVQRVVEDHGGTVRLEPQTSGAAFTILLPSTQTI